MIVYNKRIKLILNNKIICLWRKKNINIIILTNIVHLVVIIAMLFFLPFLLINLIWTDDERKIRKYIDAAHC